MATVSEEKNESLMRVRNNRNIYKITGTNISLKNSQLLTSTGIPTLDSHLGGGVAVGTVVLIEEDLFNTNCNILLKHFLAEGVKNSHTIFLVSGDMPPEKILKEIPKTVIWNKKPNDMATEEKLRIAWRYQNQRCSSVNPTSSKCWFDFSKMASADELSKCHIKSWNPENQKFVNSDEEQFVEEPYFNLLQEIKGKIISGGFETSNNTQHESILRIAVCSIGSPSWHLTGSTKGKEHNIPKFLYGLRSLLRAAYAVAVVTIPSIICKENAKLLSRIRQMADTVIGLESFVDSSRRTNPMFKEFSGLLHIIKLPVLNSFIYQTPPSDLAFKFKKRNIVIEKLHLPPDFSEHESSSQGESQPLCCSSPKGSNTLDF